MEILDLTKKMLLCHLCQILWLNSRGNINNRQDFLYKFLEKQATHA